MQIPFGYQHYVDNISPASLLTPPIDADMQDVSLDSTSIRVHQHGTGAKKGANQPKSDAQEAD